MQRDPDRPLHESAKLSRTCWMRFTGLCISIVRFKVESKAPKPRLVACDLESRPVPKECNVLGRCIASFRCVKAAELGRTSGCYQLG